CAVVSATGCSSSTCCVHSATVSVVSNATALILPAISKNVPPLINTPCLAALPIAETIATGVEMTKAHGQATTNKASHLYVHSPHVPKSNNGGTTITKSAKAKTIGVYIFAKRSIKASVGAFSSCASSTK